MAEQWEPPAYVGYDGPPPTTPYSAPRPDPAAQAHGPQFSPASWYPPPGYPPPWLALVPVQDPRDRRPGTSTAAAVLGYVNAGFMIICGLLLFAGASIVHGLDHYDGEHHAGVTAELTVDGVLNLIVAGLLIGGAVSMTNRSAVGRVVYSVGAGTVVVLSAYWCVRFDDDLDGTGRLFWASVFAVVAVVGLALAWVPDGTAWLHRRSRD